jgi:hypothetical protein
MTLNEMEVARKALESKLQFSEWASWWFELVALALFLIGLIPTLYVLMKNPEIRDLQRQIDGEKDREARAKSDEMNREITAAKERIVTAEKVVALAQERAARDEKAILLMQQGWPFDSQDILDATKGFPPQRLDVMVCKGSGSKGTINFALNVYRGINRWYFGANPKWSVRIWYLDFGGVPFPGVRVQVGSSADKHTVEAADAIFRALKKQNIPGSAMVEGFKENLLPRISDPATGQFIVGKISPVGTVNDAAWDDKYAASIRMIVGDIPIDFLNQ